ncbi:multiple inositol polyphosphate phosphatase 1-like isoform X2 [Chrysoperla carnea]|nr:multiple inositol polyphosphate phosphatase 1-like isoform X2 [Chrysoperla carnea]
MTKLLSIFFCIFFTTIYAQYRSDYCLSRDDNPYLFFAKKTPYEFVHERENNRQHIVPECRPVQYWSLIRHGERLPGISRLNELRDRIPRIQKDIIRNYRELRSYPQHGRICEDDLIRIERWHWNSSYDTTHLVTQEALNEMKFLAKRLKTKFDKVFFSDNLNDYVFKHTEETANSEVYKAFLEGLFDDEAYKIQNVEILSNNTLKGNPHSCKAFENTLRATDEESSEPKKFLRRSDIQRMIKDIGDKLGYRYSLDFNQINLMYEMCRIEKSINIRGVSTWCTVFTKEQLKLFEYYYDLLYYYQSGYGNRFSRNIGCHYVRDMLDYFREIANRRDSMAPKAIISFAKSIQLQTLLVALDFFKDPYMLSADDYNAYRKNAWRISEISPFAGNLAAVMYECTSSRYKVMFFLNEKPIEHSDCQVGLCDWEILQRRLNRIIENCNYDFCATGVSGSNSSYKFSSLFVLSFCLIFAKKFM